MSNKLNTDIQPTLVDNLTIISNEDPSKSVNLAAKGLVALYYHESILSDTIKVSVQFVDTGITGENLDNKNVLEGLPLVGTEKVEIKITDNSGNKIGDKPKLNMYINNVNPVGQDTRKGLVSLDMVSKEFLLNEKVRLRKRYDGKISDHIEMILKKDKLGDGIQTEKNIDIEPTINNLNFIGNNLKTFYTLNWLAKKSISAQNQNLGSSGGYFFYETSEGYHFKSIDGLLSQEPKRYIFYNDVPDEKGKNRMKNDKGQDYDYKALEYSKDNLINAQSKLRVGTNTTRVVLFDPFRCIYEVKTLESKEIEENDKYKTGGKKLPTFNKELNVPGKDKEFSRTTFHILDTGSLPTGNTEQQIEKSGEENFEYGAIVNQSIMRYNQFLSFSASITIPADFDLHAGDAIYLDVPLLEGGVDRIKNKSNMDGGLYIITDLTHFISGGETLTKLALVRDSFGKKRN
jgi:NADPH-dependent 7-cyano-7-deazaguanine reductase QueF-like protein